MVKTFITRENSDKFGDYRLKSSCLSNYLNKKMSETKKTGKSKFTSKNMSELLNDSQFVQNIPKKKLQKRQKSEPEDDDMSELMGLYQASSKKKSAPVLDSKKSRQKLLEVFKQQQDSRNHLSENFVKNLLDIITQLEADFEVLKENEQKLEHLANVFIKCIRQSSSAQKQNLKALRDIHTLFKKECEQLESDHKTENNKLANELEEDINILKQQLVAETKRKQVENLRKSIFQAIQNDL